MAFGKENPCNQNFQLAVELLNQAIPGSEFKIEKVYLDYGAGMLWDTVIRYQYRKEDSIGITPIVYQILTPNEWKKLYSANNEDEVTEVANELISRISDTGY